MRDERERERYQRERDRDTERDWDDNRDSGGRRDWPYARQPEGQPRTSSHADVDWQRNKLGWEPRERDRALHCSLISC